MSTVEPEFRWRSIALPALLPTILFSIGEGALIPIIPLVADDLGATLAIAGFVAALFLLGELVGNLPSGLVIARTGERAAMIGAAGLSMLGVAVCLVAPNPWVLGLGVLLVGLSAAIFGLARHAFLTSFVPIAYRARALATLGGTFRLGFFVGPFLTAVVIQFTGIAVMAFWIHLVACAGAALILLLMRDPTTSFGAVRAARHDGAAARDGAVRAGLFRTVHENRGMLIRLGTGAALVAALRTSRQVILPLWAVSIGVGGTTTALIIGLAGALDFALFYTGGAIMDRFGRLWAVVPSMIGLSAGHLVLALTHDVTASATWFVVAAMVLALANGPGAGILMTLGADLSDPADPAPFLGAWRFTTGLGGAGAPLLIAGVTAVASISVAAAVMGALGLIGAGILARYVPRRPPRAPDPQAEPS